jgi:hypothetical protein
MVLRNFSSKQHHRMGHFERLECRRVLATEGELVTIERSIDTSAMSGNISGTITWNDGTSSAAQIVSQPNAGSLRIRFDYSLDTNGFFASQSRRDLLQLAADTLITKFADSLTAIVPSGVNTWNASFQNPTTGQMTSVQNLNVAANELVIYVGARALSGSTLALASIGGYSAGGTQSFLDTIKARGQTGALASTPTDFGPWGGSIAFQSTANWHFSNSTTGLESTESDFLSAAIHELCHVLGFGTAPSWATNLSGTQFVGNNAKGKYDLGGNIPTDSIRVHWVEGTTDGGQETLMDPTLSKGVRKALTRLDLAGLQDIGWTLIEPTATIRGSHTFADNGSFDVDVQLVGARSGFGGWSQTLSITNAAPILAAISNFNVIAGTPLVVPKLGVFTDLGYDNPLDSPPTQERFTYRIEWGDGTAAQSGNANVESMGKAGTATKGFFDGSHVYATPGTYNALARITDDDGGTHTRTFTINVQAAPQLTLSVSKSVVDENAGLRATILTVRRTGNSPGALTVNLNSSDTSELRLPLTTTIPSGATEVQVDVEAVDDSILDGNITVTLTASAVGFGNGTTQVEVADYEVITGTVNQTAVNENVGSSLLTWTLSRSNTDQASPLVLQLSSSDATELVVPATATIPAGSASITIPVVVQDDSILDGTIVVMLSANAAGYRSNSNSVSVLDVESLQLIVDRSRLVEKNPVDSTRATVKLSFPAPVGGYLVQLTPSINGQLSLPGSVLVPQGSQSIDFEIAAIDDYGVEGAMSLELLATGTGISSAAVDLFIEDNDEPLWQNPVDKWDTDNNRVFNAMDALTIINNLNRYGTRYLRPGIDLSSPPYVDTNGDGIVNAIDALMVINELNRRFSA